MEISPEDTKQSESLKIFKNKIKKWVPSGCPCRLCRIYLLLLIKTNKIFSVILLIFTNF